MPEIEELNLCEHTEFKEYLRIENMRGKLDNQNLMERIDKLPPGNGMLFTRLSNGCSRRCGQGSPGCGP
jgi:hypothetical protein